MIRRIRPDTAPAAVLTVVIACLVSLPVCAGVWPPPDGFSVSERNVAPAAAFVGGTSTVRGFDEQRFAGEGALYGSGELRLRVYRPRVVVPASVGLFGFVDTGRVFMDGESPAGWHTATGGGVFFQPIRQPYIARLGAGHTAEATKLFLAFGLPY